jgi:uncharacterized damage-inducible protein DinB
MAMSYSYVAIPDAEVPRAARPLFQHMLDTYASETNKVISLWREFRPENMAFRPHERSMTVEDVMKHELLSQRRFFGEFLGAPEPAAGDVIPASRTPEGFSDRLRELAVPRLGYLAKRDERWWLEQTPFFDVKRERIWVFWRRLLHTAHHRAELVVYLRLAGLRVPPVYGPTADFSWQGADPTTSAEAAGRK